MFLTNNTMNIFTDARGHDRLSLIYYPFTIEEEVTSDGEDVSVEKGTKQETRRRVCAWTWSAAQPVIVVVTDGGLNLSQLEPVYHTWPRTLKSAHFRNWQKFCSAWLTRSIILFFSNRRGVSCTDQSITLKDACCVCVCVWVSCALGYMCLEMEWGWRRVGRGLLFPRWKPLRMEGKQLLPSSF